jgi:hypothetical protein
MQFRGAHIASAAISWDRKIRIEIALLRNFTLILAIFDSNSAVDDCIAQQYCYIKLLV